MAPAKSHARKTKGRKGKLDLLGQPWQRVYLSVILGSSNDVFAQKCDLPVVKQCPMPLLQKAQPSILCIDIS